MKSNTANGPDESVPNVGVGAKTKFSELASNALRYWEPRRLIYNLVLFAVVFLHFYNSWPTSKAFMTGNSLYGFFFLAVLANIAYCAAYLVDLFVQFSGQGATWARWRWTVLAIGIAFGAVIAHFFTLGILNT